VHFDPRYVVRPAFPEATAAEGGAGAAEFAKVAAWRVAICICSAHRPKMLRQCLRSIGSQAIPPSIAVEVVVVDNEAAPNNRLLVKSLSASYPYPIHYVHEPRRGISKARNAAIAKCRRLGVDWVAFTDDDCRVSSDWLANLMMAAHRHNADIVCGRRELILPDGCAWPILAVPSPGKAARGGTYNVLFAARLIRPTADAEGMRFDERLAHGEDTDFFHRAQLGGARIAHASEAVVFETVSKERATLRYRAKRAYYVAASRSSFHRRHAGVTRALLNLSARYLVQAPVGMCRLVASTIVWPIDERAGKSLLLKGAERLMGVAGATVGLLGYRGNPYRSIDGY
jgi:succinoglycan biosynthesis protein ExoM